MLRRVVRPMKTHDWQDKCPVTRKHHQKSFLWEGERVWVDERLINLIPNLFKLGIFTFSSCQASCGGWCNRKHRLITKRAWYLEKGKRVYYWKYAKPKACKESIWLVFPSTKDAMKLLNVVYRDDDPEDLKRQIEGYGWGTRRKKELSWIWKTKTWDVNDQRHMDHRGYWVGKVSGPPKFDFFCSVVFPRAHFDLVCQRVQEAADRKRK